jgi:beta-glucosidase
LLIIAQRLLKKKTTILPFGYGLSYSSFNYTDLKLSMSKEGLTAEFSIKNESPNLGKAVPMMFLTFPKNIGNYPEYIFKGFEKIEIKPDETIKVKIIADDHDLSYFNVTQNKYVRVCEGKIKVYISEYADISKVKLKDQINAKY